MQRSNLSAIDKIERVTKKTRAESRAKHIKQKQKQKQQLYSGRFVEIAQLKQQQ